MKVDGHCLCGFIKVEADVDPERVTICHCTDICADAAFRVFSC